MVTGSVESTSPHLCAQVGTEEQACSYAGASCAPCVTRSASVQVRRGLPEQATVLPQTGAAGGLILWGALGLTMLLLGLVLLAGQRRRAPVDGREVLPVA